MRPTQPGDRSRVRRNDIQGLRAVAVLMVVAFHGELRVSGGFTGVDVFFVISGFVITQLLVRELRTTSGLSLGWFYARRAKRLLPGLAVMLAITAIAGVLLVPVADEHTAPRTGIAASFFLANAYVFHLGTGYFDTSTSFDPFLHTWTLAVEEQFYLVFPLLLLVGWVVGRRFRRETVFAAAAIVLVSAASFALSLYLSNGGEIQGVTSRLGAPSSLAFYSSPSRAWEFGVGALIALTPVRLPRVFAASLALAGLAAIGVALFTIEGTNSYPGWAALLPVVGAAAVILAGSDARARNPSWLLGLRPLTWIGDRSYSWYLWHWPLIVYAKALWPQAGSSVPLAAAVLSIVPAALSYRFVENPIRRRQLSRPDAARIATVSVAGAAAACAVMLVGASIVGHTARGRVIARSQAEHADIVRGCEGTVPAITTRASCTWVSRPSKGVVMLVGDSVAGEFVEPVVRAALQDGFTVAVGTRSGCPFIDLRVSGSFSTEPDCLEHNRLTFAALEQRHPSLVIIGSQAAEYIRSPGNGLAPLAAGSFVNSTAGKARLWQQGLISTLARLNRDGIPVLVLQPPPVFRSPPTECAVILVLTDRCRLTASRSTVEAFRQPAVQAQNRAVTAASKARTLDITDSICGPTRCSQFRDRTLAYRNRDHLSIDGALLFTRLFQAAIRKTTGPYR